MPRKPSKTQLRIVEMTKRSPLIKTLSEQFLPKWSLADGTPVSQSAAENCVRNGLVVAQQDGLFGNSQSWAAP